MIKSFRHRGLKRLYERRDRSGIRPDRLDVVEDILARLGEADMPQALNLLGYRLHLLRGDQKGFLGRHGACELAYYFPFSRY